MKNVFKKIAAVTCVLAISICVSVTGMTAYALEEEEIPKGNATVDGVIDPVWDYASEKIHINTLNIGDSAKNASGWARLMWDDKAMYVLGYVSDTTVSSVITGDPWETDSFEFFLNEQNKKNTDFKWIDQFRADRLGRFSGMIEHIISTEEKYKQTFPGIEWASKAVEGSNDYVVEFKVPWKSIEAKAGTKLRVAFQINDDYNNDGTAEGVITSEVTETFNPSMLAEMKLVSDKAQVPKKETSSKTDTASKQTQSEQSTNTTKPQAASKTESVADDSGEDASDADVTDKSGDTVTAEKQDDNTVVTTVTETVNQKLLNTVIFVAAAAVLAVAIVCATVIIIVYKKKK